VRVAQSSDQRKSAHADPMTAAIGAVISVQRNA